MRHSLAKSLIVNILLVVIAVAVSYSAARMVRDALVVRRESSMNNAKIEELKKKKQELEQYLAELQTKEAMEREAKERLNLKKIGEKVVVIVPDKMKDAIQGVSSEGFWGRITSFFRR